jgi:hypothetical protein
MNKNNKLLSMFAATLFLAACGGGSSSSIEDLATTHTISGQVQQGNIQGATVFLDLNGNGKQDVGEPASTATGADGKFTLSLNAAQTAALNASSTAKIVSVGGTDTTTKLEAGLLVSDVAPVTGASSTKNVTAMTTLVAMTPDAKKADLKTVLGTLGMKDSAGKANDDALIETSTPAVIGLSKSVESALLNVKKSTDDTVARAAAAEMGKALAAKKGAEAELTDTTKLADTLSTAAGTALANNNVPGVTTATAVINKGCKDVAELVRTHTGGNPTLSTEDHSKKESEIMAEVGDQIKSSVDGTTAEVETETHHGGTTTTTTTTTGGTTTDTGTHQ